MDCSLPASSVHEDSLGKNIGVGCQFLLRRVTYITYIQIDGLPWWLSGKESTCNAREAGLIPGLRRFSGKKMAMHSSILVWRISWTEESGWLQSIQSQRFRHDLATKEQQQQQMVRQIDGSLAWREQTKNEEKDQQSPTNGHSCT